MDILLVWLGEFQFESIERSAVKLGDEEKIKLPLFSAEKVISVPLLLAVN